MALRSEDPFRTFRRLFRLLKPIPGAVEGLASAVETGIASKFPKKIASTVEALAAFLAARPAIAFLLFFALICSRAVHWLSNPQFFIEDGPEFYAPAFNEGLSTLTREYASYFHAVHRILALAATLFPLRVGPLAMELLAIAVQSAAAAFVVSKRLAQQLPSNVLRFFLAFFLIAHPYSDELFGNVAHAQWFLAIVSLCIVYAEPAKGVVRKGVDWVVLGLNCLTGPYAPIVALAAWTKWKRDKTGIDLAVISSVTALITLVEILTHPRAGLAHVHRFALFERMIANQVVTGPIMGLDYLRHSPMIAFFDPIQSATALFGVSVLIWGLTQSPSIIRTLALLGVFCSLTSLISKATWFGLGNPGMGERYFFYLGLVFVYCVFAVSRTAPLAMLRWSFRALLACSAFAVVTNWVYDPPYPEWNYLPQIAKYDRLKPGEWLPIKTPGSKASGSVKWITWLRKK